jgi:hypothetical protein
VIKKKDNNWIPGWEGKRGVPKWNTRWNRAGSTKNRLGLHDGKRGIERKGAEAQRRKEENGAKAQNNPFGLSIYVFLGRKKRIGRDRHPNHGS